MAAIHYVYATDGHKGQLVTRLVPDCCFLQLFGQSLVAERLIFVGDLPSLFVDFDIYGQTSCALQFQPLNFPG